MAQIEEQRERGEWSRLCRCGTLLRLMDGEVTGDGIKIRFHAVCLKFQEVIIHCSIYASNIYIQQFICRVWV